MSMPETAQDAPPAPEMRPTPPRLKPIGRPRTVRLLEHSRLPRAMRRHDGPDGVAYTAYLLPMLRHLGLWPLLDFAVDAAREAGLAMLTLRRLEADLETLQARSGPGRRRKLELRLEARIRKARVSKMLCERDLARLAKSHATGNGHGGADDLAARLLRLPTAADRSGS